MSNEKMDEMNILMGGKDIASSTPTENVGVTQAVFDKTNHELDVARGRLKTLDARNKELEKEVAELKALKMRKNVVSSALSDEERANFDPNFLDAAAKIAAASVDSFRQEYEERDRIRQEQDAANRTANEERMKKDFVNCIEGKYPGFLSSISAGGGNSELWKNFIEFNGPSISAAVSRYDVNALSYFIDKFNSELNIRVPSGSQGNATSPEPRNLGSGATVVHHGGPNKVYTADEYAALEKQAEQLRRRGDWDGYRKLCDELNNILAEDRVKD